MISIIIGISILFLFGYDFINFITNTHVKTTTINNQSCPNTDDCVLDFTTGIKDCTTTYYNPLSETCTKANSCDSVYMPYALNKDGSTNYQVCSYSYDNCPCSNVVSCPNVIAVMFDNKNYSQLPAAPFKGLNDYYCQISIDVANCNIFPLTNNTEAIQTCLITNNFCLQGVPAIYETTGQIFVSCQFANSCPSNQILYSTDNINYSCKSL